MTQALLFEEDALVERFKPTAIMASAGAGKTYQLTNRYLGLLLAGAEAQTILASTFTRAAAGEIRDRALRRLAEAARDAVACAELGRALDQQLTRAKVRSTLRGVVQQLHRLQVGTLDAYFGAIARSFALELGLPDPADIVVNHDEAVLRTRAIRQMLDERDPQPLIDLLRWLSQGDEQRSVQREIEEVVTRLFTIGRETDDEAWECVPRLPGLLERPALIDAIEHLRELRLPTRHKGIAGSHGRSVSAALAHDWEKFLDGGYPEAIAAEKLAFWSNPIEDSVRDAYEPLVHHAQAHFIERIRQQTLATRDLLRRYTRQYERLQAEERSLTFDDITIALADAELSGQLDAIHYRIDATLRHLLLDEFQDTSAPQWRVLEPLAREIVANAPPEYSFFCVGDLKQSIYGWRGATPEILAHLDALLEASHLEQKSLARSFRSSQPVIDAVNQVFQSLGASPAMSKAPEVVELWRARFQAHATEKMDQPGYVELRTVSNDRDTDARNAARWTEAANLVAELHEARPDLSVGVLTRSNDDARQMMFELGPGRRELPIGGPEGGRLDDSIAVNFVLDLLRVADHPGDTIAAFNVAHSPLGALLGLSKQEDRAERCALAREVRRSLLLRGYANIIAEWARQLAPTCSERECLRLMQLVEVASSYDRRASLRPIDFVRLAEAAVDEEGQPAPIQIMTVHKAKGLEFDIVVLPELEDQLGSHHPMVVYERDGPAGRITNICRYVKTNLRDRVPELAKMHAAHDQRTINEDLCLLYVAVTRARHALYMVVDAARRRRDGSPSTRRTLAGVVCDALAPGNVDVDTIIYGHGDPAWMRNVEQREIPDAEPKASGAPRTIDLAPSRSATTRRIAPPPSARHGAAMKRFGIDGSSDDEALLRGLALHALFERVQWIEDFETSDEALIDVVRGSAPRRDEAWARSLVASFRRCLEHEAIRPLLSRGETPAGDMLLWREAPFARVTERGLQSGFMDRVSARRDADGSIQEARVIDYKSDTMAVDDAAVQAKTYAAQLEAYREPAARLIGVLPEDIELRIAFVVAGVVV